MTHLDHPILSQAVRYILDGPHLSVLTTIDADGNPQTSVIFVKRDGELVGLDLDHAVGLAETACERVLATITSGEQPLLAPTPDGFADMINTMAAQNLARAWSIDPQS